MDAQNEESNSASVNNCLSELVIVLGDAAKGKRCGFFNRWIELLETVN